MDSGIYAAYTGLLARTQALDTAANNLANAGTNGFRAQRDTFRGVLASGFSYDQIDRGQAGSQVGDGVNSFGVMGGSLMDLGQGTVVPTGNALDLALSGPGFFAIQTANGIRYTRDGSFLKSPDGQLQTQQGEPVLDAQMQPITLPTGVVEVSGNGTVSVDAAVVGTVGLFDISGTSLTMEGSNRYAAAAGVTPAAADATVKQGAVEGSNMDAVHGTMQLILLQRQAEMMQKALGVFSNDFDKTAVEQIGRVG
jgi:flagellar basal-body rod protein FlgF/flagellar basal-body rod protein FlgG